jgi:co-chaperonin GroES (HSP10)
MKVNFQTGEKFTPTGQRILIKIDENKEITEGGIVVPFPKNYLPETGVILAISPAIKNDMLAVGKHIVFDKYQPIPVFCDNDDKSLRIIDEKYVYGVLED